MVFGWPAAWIAVPALVVVALGLTRMAHERRGFLAWSGAFYAMAILGHPYPVDRYLVPLVPVAIVCLVLGLATLVRDRSLGRLLGSMLIAVILACHVLWLARYREVVDRHTHGAFGRPLVLEWTELTDTLSWIERHTLPEEVIASPRDSIVFAYTGRHGVRSWIHLPETWVESRQRRLTVAEVAVLVRREFARLRVDYVLVEPPLHDAEGQFGKAVIEALGVGGPRFPMVFSSRNGHFRLYRVAAGEAGTVD